MSDAVLGELRVGGAPAGGAGCSAPVDRLQLVPAPPALLAAASVLVVAVLVLPLAFLLVEAAGAGWLPVWHLIDRSLTFTLLWNTVRLTVVVTALCALIGTGAAYVVECTDVPGRHIWAVLVVVPLAVPDFIVSFGWSSLFPAIQGYPGAILVMTLAVYPLVYLPVAASLRHADRGQLEIARSLGVGRVSAFWRITMGQARRAVLGGCLLVALVLLAEYGAFEILGYQTFTTEIYTEQGLSFDTAGACALSLVLVVLSLVVLAGERAAGGRAVTARSGAGAARVLARDRLGRFRIPVLAALGALVLAALGVPVGASVYWLFAGGSHAITGVSLLSAAWHTALYGAGAGLLATLAALPVALVAVRHGRPAWLALERSSFLVLAVPGVVVAFAFSYFTERYAAGFGYQTAPLLVLAYAILFFPLALVGVRASVQQAPPALEQLASSLGARRLSVLWRVSLPLVMPGLAAAFSLVFLSVVTELTATLILVPTGVQTLATQFWAYEQNLSYGQAAPFALVMIAVAALPSYLLGRFFDKLPSRQRVPVVETAP